MFQQKTRERVSFFKIRFSQTSKFGLFSRRSNYAHAPSHLRRQRSTMIESDSTRYRNRNLNHRNNLLNDLSSQHAGARLERTWPNDLSR